MDFDRDDQERMNNFMLKGAFMTDKELEEGAKWFTGARVAIVAILALVLSILIIVAHA